MSKNVKERVFTGVRALVCDDDDLNQKILLRLLARYGVDGISAGDGRAGLQLLTDQAFDIAFIDLKMPILDGEKMAQLARENSDQRVAQTLLVAVTGAAHYFQERTLDETPFDDYIVKPITAALVFQALLRAFPHK